MGCFFLFSLKELDGLKECSEKMLEFVFEVLRNVELDLFDGFVRYVLCELFGVVVVLVFWNYLFLILVNVIVFVFVVGNIVIFKYLV